MTENKFQMFKDFAEDEELECISCHSTLPSEVQSYKHPDGLPDETGTTWWAYITCNNCQKQNSYKKLLTYYLALKEAER